MKKYKYGLLVIILIIVLGVITIIQKENYEVDKISKIINLNTEDISNHKDDIKNIIQYEIETVKSITKDNFTTPNWSPDGQSITYSSIGYNGILIMDKDGSNGRVLTSDLGSGYKYLWSLDNNHIAYRGTKFENNKRIQFIGVIDIKKGTTEIISTLQNISLQPPWWYYSDSSKQVVYITNGKLIYSKKYPFSAKSSIFINQLSDANRFLYYSDGNLCLIEKDSATKIIVEKGFDPVFSPDRQKFIYSKWNQLFLFSFENNSNKFLDTGYHPSWSPDGSKIVYHKSIDDGEKIIASDLLIFDFENLKKQKLTNTIDIIEVNPSWGLDGRSILYNDEKTGTIHYLILKNYN